MQTLKKGLTSLKSYVVGETLETKMDTAVTAPTSSMTISKASPETIVDSKQVDLLLADLRKQKALTSSKTITTTDVPAASDASVVDTGVETMTPTPKTMDTYKEGKDKIDTIDTADTTTDTKTSTPFMIPESIVKWFDAYTPNTLLWSTHSWCGSQILLGHLALILAQKLPNVPSDLLRTYLKGLTLKKTINGLSKAILEITPLKQRDIVDKNVYECVCLFVYLLNQNGTKKDLMSFIDTVFDETINIAHREFHDYCVELKTFCSSLARAKQPVYKKIIGKKPDAKKVVMNVTAANNVVSGSGTNEKEAKQAAAKKWLQNYRK